MICGDGSKTPTVLVKIDTQRVSLEGFAEVAIMAMQNMQIMKLNITDTKYFITEECDTQPEIFRFVAISLGSVSIELIIFIYDIFFNTQEGNAELSLFVSFVPVVKKFCCKTIGPHMYLCGIILAF